MPTIQGYQANNQVRGGDASQAENPSESGITGQRIASFGKGLSEFSIAKARQSRTNDVLLGKGRLQDAVADAVEYGYANQGADGKGYIPKFREMFDEKSKAIIEEFEDSEVKKALEGEHGELSGKMRLSLADSAHKTFMEYTQTLNKVGVNKTISNIFNNPLDENVLQQLDDGIEIIGSSQATEPEKLRQIFEFRQNAIRAQSSAWALLGEKSGDAYSEHFNKAVETLTHASGMLDENEITSELFKINQRQVNLIGKAHQYREWSITEKKRLFDAREEQLVSNFGSILRKVLAQPEGPEKEAMKAKLKSKADLMVQGKEVSIQTSESMYNALQKGEARKSNELVPGFIYKIVQPGANYSRLNKEVMGAYGLIPEHRSALLRYVETMKGKKSSLSDPLVSKAIKRFEMQTTWSPVSQMTKPEFDAKMTSAVLDFMETVDTKGITGAGNLERQINRSWKKHLGADAPRHPDMNRIENSKSREDAIDILRANRKKPLVDQMSPNDMREMMGFIESNFPNGKPAKEEVKK